MIIFIAVGILLQSYVFIISVLSAWYYFMTNHCDQVFNNINFIKKKGN